jgi:branched-chain amino acid transport system permease protein
VAADGRIRITLANVGGRISGRGLAFALIAAFLTIAGGIAAIALLVNSDPQQAYLCEALVPVIEPSEVRVTLNRVAVDSDNQRVAVLYRVEWLPTADRPRRTEVHHVICHFAGNGFDTNRLVLLAVETSHGYLTETQLLFLNKRWASDAEALSTAQALLNREGQARPQGVMKLDPAIAYFVQQVVNAGAPTALYALLALAYSLVYGLTNRINLAFGEIATIGAYGALIGIYMVMMFGATSIALGVPIALVLAAALAGGNGAIIGRLAFLPLLGRSTQAMLVATIGLAVAIEEFIARTQGVEERWLQPILADPHVIASGPFEVVVTTMQLVVTGTAASVALILLVVLRFSGFGRAWRAVSDDRLMARMIGIDVDRLIVASFALASCLAGIGGALLTLHYGGASFALGTAFGLKALVAAIVGGIGSLGGALIGGLTLGLVEAVWSAYEPIVWRDGFVFIVLAVFLTLRPDGILGTRRAVEEREQRP